MLRIHAAAANSAATESAAIPAPVPIFEPQPRGGRFSSLFFRVDFQFRVLAPYGHVERVLVFFAVQFYERNGYAVCRDAFDLVPFVYGDGKGDRHFVHFEFADLCVRIGACGQIARFLRNFHVEIDALRGRTVARQTDIGVSRGEIRAFGGRIRHHFAARREGRALVGDLRDQRNAVTVCEQRLEVRAVIGETRFGRRAVSHQIHALRDRLRRAAVAQIEHNHAARARVRPRSLHARLRQSQRGEQRIQKPGGRVVRDYVRISRDPR